MERDDWAPDYLKFRSRGLQPGDACEAAGVPRQTLSDYRRRDPEFARDEQMIRDREDVDLTIAEMDRDA